MTREHPDNLRKGQYVVLTGCKSEEGPQPFIESDPWNYIRRPQKMSWNGRPLRVVHVEFPFLIVEDDNGVGTIDLREFYVKVVSKRYAELGSKEAITSKKRRKVAGSLIPTRKRKSKPDKDACPRCHGPTRLVKRINREGWFRYCPQCNIDLERIE